jgi:hypothetical protein
MPTLTHPQCGDSIKPILLAQGLVDGVSLGVIARLKSAAPPQIRYASQINVLPTGVWTALFTDLPVGVVFDLELFDETGQLVGSAFNLEVTGFAAGPQILFPIDGQTVCHQFATYGLRQNANPLECHKVEKGAESFNGTEVPYAPNMFAFSFNVPAGHAGPGWTLRVGNAADCTGSSTSSITLKTC